MSAAVVEPTASEQQRTPAQKAPIGQTFSSSLVMGIRHEELLHMEGRV